MPREIPDPGWRHPYGDEDPTDDLSDLMHEERKAALRLFSAIVDEMPDTPEKWGVSFAIGTANCAGRSMSEIAATLGVTRAIISHRARAFCIRHNIPPSPYMKGAK